LHVVQPAGGENTENIGTALLLIKSEPQTRTPFRSSKQNCRSAFSVLSPPDCRVAGQFWFDIPAS